MHFSGKPSPCPKPGFTLVEILCAGVILAILASVATIGASGAIASAKRAKCASNMRQIGIALISYAGDHQGMLPVSSHSTGDNKVKVNGQWVKTIELSWIYTLAPYLGNMDEVRICPADEKARRDTIVTLHATSYILNDAVIDSERYNRLQNLADPARTMLMFISNRPVSRTWDHAHCNNWTNWGALTTDIAPDRHRRGAPAADHLKGGANYLYADGRVETIPAPEMKRKLESGIHPWLPGGSP